MRASSFLAALAAAAAAAVNGQQTGYPPSPAPTLTPNAFWIRAVAAPNFHKYLQSSHPGSAGAAVLGSAKTAGQFVIAYGRLILLGDGVDLDAIVSEEVIGQNEDGTGGRLAVTFREGGGSGRGGFVYSGDTVGWRRGGLERPDEGAWLVCGGELFVNLGAYGEGTPEGCVDQTIHFYFGATAEV